MVSEDVLHRTSKGYVSEQAVLYIVEADLRLISSNRLVGTINQRISEVKALERHFKVVL